jgi:hypothetical protein
LSDEEIDVDDVCERIPLMYFGLNLDYLLGENVAMESKPFFTFAEHCFEVGKNTVHKGHIAQARFHGGAIREDVYFHEILLTFVSRPFLVHASNKHFLFFLSARKADLKKGFQHLVVVIREKGGSKKGFSASCCCCQKTLLGC